MFKKMIATILLPVGVFLLAGCQQDNSSDTTPEETVTNLTVATYLPPMTDIIEVTNKYITDLYTVNLLEVTDNQAYNQAVESGAAEANLGQHAGYLSQYNNQNDANLIAVQPVYTAIVGYYSPSFNSIEEITENSTVAIPKDPSNEARALNLLETSNLITTNSRDSLKTSIENIVDNPLNLTFEKIDLLDAGTAYENGIDLVFSYPTYIKSAGVSPDDVLVLEEDSNQTFAIQLVTTEELAESEAIQALVVALTSKEMGDFITHIGQGNIKPAF